MYLFNMFVTRGEGDTQLIALSFLWGGQAENYVLFDDFAKARLIINYVKKYIELWL